MVARPHTEFNNFIYPNHLDGRNAVALPGHVLAIDLFQLAIMNSKKPGDSFKAMIAVDMATAEIIAHAVLRIANSLKGAPTREPAFLNKTVSHDLIIHTDRGPQFTSEEWHLCVQQLGATGSMSDVARPKDNAVAECTIKSQL